MKTIDSPFNSPFLHYSTVIHVTPYTGFLRKDQCRVAWITKCKGLIILYSISFQSEKIGLHQTHSLFNSPFLQVIGNKQGFFSEHLSIFRRFLSVIIQRIYRMRKWWALQDLNLRPRRYEHPALTN